jgi:hypothetical protein
VIEKGFEKLLPAARLPDRTAHGFSKRAHVRRNVVGQVRVLGLSPYSLRGVEFRSVRRKPLNEKSFRKSPEQPFGGRSMHPQPIQYRDERTAVLSKNVRNELVKHSRVDVAPEYAKAKSDLTSPGRQHNAGSNGKAVSPIPTFVNGCFSLGRPSPAHRGLKHKPALVKETDAITLGLCFFLYVANRVCAIAQPLEDLALALFSRASDKTNSYVSADTMPPSVHTLRRISSGSPALHVRASTNPWRIHAWGLP